jgi:hypothetical protein
LGDASAMTGGQDLSGWRLTGEWPTCLTLDLYRKRMVWRHPTPSHYILLLLLQLLLLLLLLLVCMLFLPLPL